MELPILRFFDQLHRQLDAVEASWPLQFSRLVWIREVHRLLRDEWLDLDRRIRQLTPLLEHQEEAYQRFQRSVGYLELRMYREAKEQLDAIIRAVPDTVLSYLLRAIVLYELHEYEKALHDLRLLDAVVDAPPLSGIIRHLLACALAKTGRWEEAKDRFEQLYRLNPGNEEVMFNLALCYYHLGYLQQALYLMRNLSALRPGDQQMKQLLAYFSRHATT